MRPPQLSRPFLTAAFKAHGCGAAPSAKHERHDGCVTLWVHGLSVTLPTGPSEDVESYADESSAGDSSGATMGGTVLDAFLASSNVVYGTTLYCRLGDLRQAAKLYAHHNRVPPPDMKRSDLTAAFQAMQCGAFVSNKRQRRDGCVTSWVDGLSVSMPTAADPQFSHEPSFAIPEGEAIHSKTTLLMEKKVQDMLLLQVGGQTEVHVPTGRVDILTPFFVIEIKHGRSWMHGIGQLQAYGQYFPERRKILQLFGNIPVNTTVEVIKTTCHAIDIDVWFWPY